MAGRNRLQAAEELGWDVIDAIELPALGNEDAETLGQLAEIAENIHRREITALERAELYARWVKIIQERGAEGARLANLEKQSLDRPDALAEAKMIAKGAELISAQVGPKSKSVKNPKGAGRKMGGMRQAARLAGVSRQDLHRFVDAASLSPEAKEAAKRLGLDNNQAALLEAAKAETPAKQVASIERRAAAAEKPSAKTKPQAKPKEPEPSAEPRGWRELDAEWGAAWARCLQVFEPTNSKNFG